MTVIDKETWPRRGHYDFFAPMSDPFYTLTFPVDVTALRAWCRASHQPFYPAMVYAVTKAMEEVDAFHYKDRDGVIVRHDTLVPSFTDLKPGSELFHIVTLEAGERGMSRRTSAAGPRNSRRPRPPLSLTGRGTGISWSTSPVCPGSPSQR